MARTLGMTVIATTSLTKIRDLYGHQFFKEKSNEDETYGDDFVDEPKEEESDEALAARGLKRCAAVHAFNAGGETELSVTKGESS